MDNRKLDAKAKMKRARSQLLMYHPFFGYLATKLLLTESKTFDTLATDGKHLFYNAGFLDRLTNNQGLTAVCHEVMHNVCDHINPDRQGGREVERWKKACDYAINQIIKDNRFDPISIPGVFSWLQDDQYKGMTAEEIYSKLPPEEGKGHGCVLCPKSTGKDPSNEPGQDSPGDPPPQTNWKQAVAEAAAYARAKGQLPAGIEEFVDEILNPPVDWKREIRGEFVKAVRAGWSYARPNRRYAAFGMAMPSIFGYTTTAEVWGDSSGSMTGRWPQFLGCVLGIAKALHIKLDVGICDAEVQGFYRNVEKPEDVKKIPFKGGGGTDFRPIFQHAAKRKPASLVFYTDGMGTFPERRPKFPVLWVVPAEYKEFKPPFGRKVVLPEGDLK